LPRRRTDVAKRGCFIGISSIERGAGTGRKGTGIVPMDQTEPNSGVPRMNHHLYLACKKKTAPALAGKKLGVDDCLQGNRAIACIFLPGGKSVCKERREGSTALQESAEGPQ